MSCVVKLEYRSAYKGYVAVAKEGGAVLSTAKVLTGVEKSPESEERAKQLLPAIEAELLKKHVTKLQDCGIFRVFAEYEKLRGDIKPATRNDMARCLRAFDVATKSKPVRDLIKNDLTLYFAGKDWSSNYRRKITKYVLAVLRWAGDEGTIPRGILEGIKPPPGESRGDDVMPTWEQISLIMAGKRTLCNDATLCLWESGCRPDEILGLLGSEYTNGIIEVSKERLKTNKVEGSGRRLVSPRMKIILDRRKAKYGDGPLFRTKNGTAITVDNYGTWFRKQRRKHGLPDSLIPYGMRHAFCHRCFKAGVPKDDVVRLMGHCDSEMIDRVYGHSNLLFHDSVARCNAILSPVSA